MSEMSFKINMECDSDGYVTFECPFAVQPLDFVQMKLKQKTV